MTDKKKDDDVTVVEVKPLPPTQLISVVCSSCNHPFRARSSVAFVAAREDHLAAVHAPKPPIEQVVELLGLCADYPEMEIIRDDEDGE